MKRYLGDAVYYENRGSGGYAEIVLTTENGYRATNTIVLDPSVIAALLKALGDDESFNRGKLRDAIGPDGTAEPEAL